MRLQLRLEDEQKSGAIWYEISRQSPCRQQDLKPERAIYLMVKIDDPTLALIVRFVGSNSVEPIPQQECMRLQVALIRDHVANFPSEQQEAQAMAWIEEHAQRFREECRGKLLATAG